jgi:periplasmic protein TonB
MFDQTLLLDTGTRKTWTVFAGLSGQLLALGAAMLIPLVYTDKLPLFRVIDLHIMPPIMRVPEPPPDLLKPAHHVTARRIFSESGLYVPRRIPTQIANIIDDTRDVAAETGPFIPGAIADSHSGMTGIPAIIATQPPPPPPPRPVEPRSIAATGAPTRISGGVLAALLIHKVIPPYPALAKQARVSGTVELLAVVGKDGTVKKLDVVSGHPLLVPAAIDAVRQWVYRPTLLSGEPVEVIAPISVHFTLTP